MDQETLGALMLGDDNATFDALSAAPSPQPEQADQKTSLAEQIGSGTSEGIAGMLGAPVDFSVWSGDLITRGINKLTGSNIPLRSEIGVPTLGGGENFAQAMSPFISDVQPQTKAQRFGRRAGQEVGAGVVVAPLSLAGVGARGAAAGVDLAADVGSGLAAQAAKEYLPDSVTAELLASLAGGVATAGVASGVVNIPNKAAYRKEVIRTAKETPSVKELKGRAGRLYREAEKSGATATLEQVGDLNNNIVAIALDEGLISPKGRVSKGFPKVNDALNMMSDFAGMGMTPTQMRRVRKTISKVAGSVDPDEARIGVKMIKAFDGFSSPLTPTIAKANRLYTNAMRGDTIDQAIELAGIRAGQYTGSGFENALRTEFRSLSRKIAKKQMKGLSDQQVAAIKKVAEGGAVENFWRWMGKASPSSPFSAGVTAAGPVYLAHMVGGPAAGVTAGAVTLGAGAAGRRVATTMQKENAEIAGAVMRGMTIPTRRQDPASMMRVLETWAAQNAQSATGDE